MTATEIGIISSASNLDVASVPNDEIAKLLKLHGSVLFRGFAVTIPDFEKLMDRLSERAVFHHGSYTGNRKVVGDEHTYTVQLDRHAAPWHAETSYRVGRPEIIAFHCASPGHASALTMLTDGVRVLQAMKPEHAQAARQANIRWTWVLSRDRIGDTPPADVARKLIEECAGLPDSGRGEILVEDGCVVSHMVAPMCEETKWKAGVAYCNYTICARFNILKQVDMQLTNGNPVPDNIVRDAAQAADVVAYGHEWQPNDVVLIDNSRVMHARPWLIDRGGERKISIRMGLANKRVFG